MNTQLKQRLASKCELRPGIGLCDSCLLPKWPQEYVGNGDMICLDCIAEFNRKATRTIRRRIHGR